MTAKKETFFKNYLHNLPFFFRNHKTKELQISKDYKTTYSDKIPMYQSELVECKLPNKPISKLLTFDEQKDF
ncbi:hypothetical protein U6A24_20500 [Aquimarina gracilis]|uniref:Uncharacterized protein n=1 Tax=Aquimarina gracilis TaxID=874422 RepID=A0ABU6A1C9_9FLAO|nr:hypothetical protein [Aquimarina gracilis]MEB3347870.1 hypothetical protein [Aquimarina gracilis]